MTHIKITKGLNIPIIGHPEGSVRSLVPSGDVNPLTKPKQIALDLNSFEDIKFKILVKAGDAVKIGQPLLEDKALPGRMFASPAGGVIKEIRRGLKRRLLEIVIDIAETEQHHDFGELAVESASKEAISARLMEGGVFPYIRSRPFDLLANPNTPPRHIFVKAIESAPFTPPAELQVYGHEKEFQIGLTALSKLTTGEVHLVYSTESKCKAFTEAKNVTKHTAEGPHPIGTHSVHIEVISPITGPEDILWTLNVHDVIAIGSLLATGHYYTDRVISIAGPGVLPDRVGYFRAREGYPVETLISGRIEKGVQRLVSGDPLMGHRVEPQGFLGANDYVFCVIPEGSKREFLHFFRLGLGKYSMSRAYLSGHLNNADRDYEFTTNQHGEHRAFIDATLYKDVQPLNIPTMLLVKAVMAEDFELAQTLGILDVASEDFALATFVCPSKMEMTEIMKNGLKQYAKEILQ